MEYSVYTDGTINREKGVMGIAYVIVTKEKFITMNQFKSNGVAPTKAELISMGMAAEYLMKQLHVGKEDSVCFNTDSNEAISYLTDEKSSNMFEGSKDARIALVNKMFEQIKNETNVSFKKSRAHQTTNINCNKLADRLAKYAVAVK